MNVDVFLVSSVELREEEVFQTEVREGEWRRGHNFHADEIGFYGPFFEGPLSLAPHSTFRGKLGFTDHPTLRGDKPKVSQDAKLRIVEHLSGDNVHIQLHNGRFP